MKNFTSLRSFRSLALAIVAGVAISASAESEIVTLEPNFDAWVNKTNYPVTSRTLTHENEKEYNLSFLWIEPGVESVSEAEVKGEMCVYWRLGRERYTAFRLGDEYGHDGSLTVRLNPEMADEGNDGKWEVSRIELLTKNIESTPGLTILVNGQPVAYESDAEYHVIGIDIPAGQRMMDSFTLANADGKQVGFSEIYIHKEKGGTTGVTTVAADDEAPEYFLLDGTPVAAEAVPAGIPVVERRGGVSRVVVKR